MAENVENPGVHLVVLLEGRQAEDSALRDDSLKPQGAGVPEHRLAVGGLKMLREAPGRASLVQRLMSIRVGR